MKTDKVKKKGANELIKIKSGEGIKYHAVEVV